MNPFSIARVKTFQEASTLAGGDAYSLPVIKAGGVDVVDQLKEGLLRPDLLVDVRHARDENIDSPQIERRTPTSFGVLANTTLAQVAAHDDVRRGAPAMVQACESAATPQVRNVATVAGNLLQRPRCWYFRHAEFDCLKKGGHTCYAVEGENRYHAIFGDGPCHFVHPSNVAVAMSALNGKILLLGSEHHTLTMRGLYHTPARGVTTEHGLEPGAVITKLTFDVAQNSSYYAIKEKQSFDWPVVSVAASLELDASYRVQRASLYAGAVAPIPWPLTGVMQAIRGVRLEDDAAVRAACARAVDGATPLSDNAYKLKLLPVAVYRAIMKAAGWDFEEV